MRRTSHALFGVVMACALAACASLGVPTPKTFNEKAAAALTGLTAATNTTTQLLDQRLISSNDANNIAVQLDNMRSGVDIARQLHQSQPAAGEARIETIAVALQALTDYLQTRQKGKPDEANAPPSLEAQRPSGTGADQP